MITEVVLLSASQGMILSYFIAFASGLSDRFLFLNKCSQAKDFPGSSVVENLQVNVGDVASIPGSGRSPREGKGNPLQYLAWEIPRTEEPGGLQSMGLQKSWTQLGD